MYAHVRAKVDCHWANGVPLRKFMALTPQSKAEGIKNVRELIQNGSRSEQLQPSFIIGTQDLENDTINTTRSADSFAAKKLSCSLIDHPTSTPKRRVEYVNYRRGSADVGTRGTRLLSFITKRGQFYDVRYINKIWDLAEARDDSIDKESQETVAKMKILAEGVSLPFSAETQEIVEKVTREQKNQVQDTSDYNSDFQQSQEESASGNALQPENSNST